jgi:methylmalonyl-CoA mutase N-terminal domain/subunit
VPRRAVAKCRFGARDCGGSGLLSQTPDLADPTSNAHQRDRTAWLLAPLIVTAQDNGVEPATLQGTTQNDIIKEFLVRVIYIPRRNPINAGS